MKIYGCDTTYHKICRMCDKPIGERHIALEFNSTQKAFFHKKCWEEFKNEIKKFKIEHFCPRCEAFKPENHSCFGGKGK